MKIDLKKINNYKFILKKKLIIINLFQKKN